RRRHTGAPLLRPGNWTRNLRLEGRRSPRMRRIRWYLAGLVTLGAVALVVTGTAGGGTQGAGRQRQPVDHRQMDGRRAEVVRGGARAVQEGEPGNQNEVPVRR